jgi:hypothetical protein
MKKSSLFLVSLLLTASVLLSCGGERRPDNVLDDETMASFLSEAYLLESFYAVETHYSYDAMTPEVLSAYDDILSRYHVSREDIEESFKYYSQHPEQYAAIQEKARVRIEQQTGADTLATTREDTRLVP